MEVKHPDIEVKYLRLLAGNHIAYGVTEQPQAPCAGGRYGEQIIGFGEQIMGFGEQIFFT
jgi:hypothetical protein